ncbi:hypothetical protein BROUX41_005769 [Berkeleyomyces rouxiae]|uniref:uncharacterized protein n=1 Tax=Berkeleyomyces rouxiae TaxID=2035830 RepID=UPI003B7CFF07
MASVFTITEHVIDGQHIREFPRATGSAQEAVLKLAVKQYTPKDNLAPQPRDITIVAAHACGFPKELYEALWDDLYTQLKSKGLRIKSIWIADCAWQGYSGQLNEDELGNDPSWMDYARDILHMVNVFRAEITVPVVAVGHSFGATSLVNVSLMHPRLFSSIVLLDPVITHHTTSGGLADGPASYSLYRREQWPSRAAAAGSFRRSPFYTAWDARVLDSWITHGLRDVSTARTPSQTTEPTAVALRTTKDQELFTFLRPSWDAFSPDGTKLVDRSLVPDMDLTLPSEYLKWPLYRAEGGVTLTRLPAVRPPVLYIVGETSEMSSPELRKLRLETTGTGAGGSGGVRDGKVAEEVVAGRGHLVPMEEPAQCAQFAAKWIVACMPDIRQELNRFVEWKTRDMKAKTTMSEEWKKRIPRPERAPKPSKI